jgi:alpha-beta hydrolase superfamily lysophospholipase
MARVLVIVAAALLWAAPAQAASTTSGFRTMADGTRIAYDLYQPSGQPPADGWPGVILLPGLGSSKSELAPLAQIVVAHGYAALVYSARGQGTSTGTTTLGGPLEISDERALFDFFAGLPSVSDTRIGAWGLSYGAAQVLNGLAAGIPYAAAEAVATWSDLYSALWPQDVAKTGVIRQLTAGVSSPLLAQLAGGGDAAQLQALAAERSSLTRLSSVKAPVYLFQGRVDYAFDVAQATAAYARLAGPKRLYIGQFGHPPATFPSADLDYVLAQGLAWYDRYLKGDANGVDTAPPVTIAAATGVRRVSFAGLPVTKALRLTGHGPRLRTAVETFGASTVRVRVLKLRRFPRLVATVLAGTRVITHGAVVPTVGTNVIRLADYVQYLPRGTTLTVRLGPASAGGDPTYPPEGRPGSITLGAATLTLRVLTQPVTR